MGFHIFCFVDDYCVVGDDKASTQRGCEILEATLDELGLQWAPHKRRGPVQALDFLGRFISNVPGHRGIGLSEARRASTLELISSWMGRRPKPGETLMVEPRELASLLGNLVFVSEAVRGGRTYLQSCLGQFKGLEVEWDRGLVRPSASARSWERMEVDAAFWRDLEWWADQVTTNHRFPLADALQPKPTATLAGTDASGWGTGQLVFIGGEVEEEVLRFTRAEQRRPINWRELLGILRVVERWGPDLRGRTVLVETDNLVAHYTAVRMSSRATDMQELLRRLLEGCERHDITLRTAHTPGALLFRPDELSRGDAARAPRQRLRGRWFRAIEAEWGRFEEFIGREASHTSRGAQDGGPKPAPQGTVEPLGTREQHTAPGPAPNTAAASTAQPAVSNVHLWAHPSFDSVGNTLREIGERTRAGAGTGGRVHGVVLVPHHPTARWWGMLRHVTVVGEVGAGAESLEEARGSGWAPISSRRRTLIAVFPRLAGGFCVPLNLALEPTGEWSHDPLGMRQGHTGHQALLPGAFLLRMDGDTAQVWRTHDRFAPWEPTCTQRGPTCVQLHPVPGTVRGGKETYAVRPGAPVLELPRRGALYVINAMVERDMASGGDGATTRIRLSLDACVLSARVCQERAALVSLGKSTAGAEAAVARDQAIARAEEGEPWVGLGLPVPALHDEVREAIIASRVADRDGCSTGSADLAGATRWTRQDAATTRSVGHAVCQSADTMCYGCGQGLTIGGRAAAVGGHLAHLDSSCMREAKLHFERDAAADIFIEQADLTEATAILETSEAATAGRSGAAKQPRGREEVADARRSSRRVLKVGEARCRQALRCLDGDCGCATEHDMFCHQCDRGLHGDKCVGLSPGKVLIGLYECVECMLGAAGATADAGEGARMLTVESMLSRMSSGSENFGKSMARANKYQTEFVAWMTHECGGDFAMPIDNPTSMILFLHWMASRADRSKSLRSAARALGALGGKSRRSKVINPDVQREIDSLMKAHGDDPTPKTRCTPKMFGIFINELLVEQTRVEGGATRFIRSRDRTLGCLEGVGGCRVGDAAGADDCHGLVAENVSLITKISTQESTIEAELNTGKTSFKRHINMIGETLTSRVNVSKIIEEYCKEAGFTMATRTEGDYTITQPCSTVARLLLGPALKDEHVKSFEAMLADPRMPPDVRKHAGNTMYYLKKRRGLVGNENKRYVNFAEASDEEGLRQVEALAKQWGLEAFVVLTPGPFLRASRGSMITMMPLSEGSTYEKFVKLLPQAEKRARERGDPDFDLESRTEASYGNHSLRQMADHIAKKTQALTGATDVDIDRMFGWNEAWYRKKMRLHYAGRDDRVKRAKITSYV